MTRIGNFLRHSALTGWLQATIALGAGCAYSLRFFHLSRFLNLNMDEGTYLTKGLLFANGTYVPYQFYGPWTQKMPLAYFLFGWAQMLLGPGLGSGRTVSMVFALLMLPGVWLLTARLGGKWAAVLALTYLALNQAGMIKLAYATTQAQIACFGVWMLALTVGFKPKSWQVAAGGVMAGLMVITRQNMLPYAFLWVVYLFWTQERRTAWLGAAAAGAVFLIPHIIFWPNILSAWTLLPRSLTPFLDPWRLTENVVYFDQWIPSFAVQFDAAWEGVHYFFVPLLGVIFSAVLVPAWRIWPDRTAWKTYVFLLVSWFTLLLVHFTASFFMNYGFYTFSGYIAFFDYLSLAIIALAFRRWQAAVGLPGRLLVSLLILSIPTIFLFLAADSLTFIVKWLQTPIPRVQGFMIQPGTTNLVAVLVYKLGLPIETVNRLLPTLLGPLIGLLFLAAAGLLKKFARLPSTAATAASLFLAAGLALTPSAILGRGHPELICSFDVVKANSGVGKQVASIVPARATVFWYPWLAPTPLLYLDQRKIFPAQLDDNFNIVQGGDADTVSKYGFWNEALAQKWVKQTQVILIAGTSAEYDRKIDDLYNRYGNTVELKRLGASQNAMSCFDRQYWRIFVYSVSPK